MLYPFALTYDWLMRPTEAACLRDWRADLLGRARGRVLEIGAGTGANLAHYGPAPDALVLVEPHRVLRRSLRREAAGDPRVEVRGVRFEELEAPDGSFDTAVMTLVLCSVADPEAFLRRVHRLLRPGGQLLFIEHVAATRKPGRLRWQRRIEPLWRLLFGNCHLTRDAARLIADAGFHIEELTRASMRKAFPLARPSVRGVARKES